MNFYNYVTKNYLNKKNTKGRFSKRYERRQKFSEKQK